MKIMPMHSQESFSNAGLRDLLWIACTCAALGLNTARAVELPDLEALTGAIVGLEAEVPEQARTAESLGTRRSGSGVVISDDGLILTIGYLILEASSAKLSLNDGRQFPAQIIGYDHATGFGLLRPLAAVELSALKLGDPALLKDSDPVLIMSHKGISPAVVQSRSEFAGYWEYLLDTAIFTAPPYPHYGGAALIGEEGHLLGIGSLAVGQTGDEESTPGNMFVPVDLLEPIIEDLLETGRSSAPQRPWLGLYIQEVKGHLLVTRVAHDGPAAAVGLERGDIIVGVSGQSVESLADFYRKLWASGDAGSEVTLKVVKRSKIRDVVVQSEDRYEWLRFAHGF